MDKYDVKTALKELYSPTAKDFSVVDVPRQQFLAIDGKGNPNTSPAYAAAVEALYPVAYALKFTSKNELGRDLVVAPLEGLWRADDPSAFTTRAKDTWAWTMMISQPDWITEAMTDAAIATVLSTKGLAAVEHLRLNELHEGTSVQILHIGSYDDEAPTLAKLHHEFMPAHDLAFNGDHHEIYLGDPRRVAPEKLKTVLRQPVRPK